MDLLREVKDNTPTPEEQKVIDDLLGSLQEGAFDNLLAKAKSYAKKGLLTATVIAALVASPELTSAQKSQIQSLPTTQTTATTKKAPTGTAVDGIIGQYTSQFIFPKAYDTINRKRIDLGFEGNEALKKISSFDKGKMQQWNNFVNWMKSVSIEGKKVSGNPILDTDPSIGMDALEMYKQTPGGKNFWVKDTNDIKAVQDFIKAYRVYTVADWKLGDGEGKGGHGTITLQGRHMRPDNPADVKAVESDYMKWAKD